MSYCTLEVMAYVRSVLVLMAWSLAFYLTWRVWKFALRPKRAEGSWNSIAGALDKPSRIAAVALAMVLSIFLLGVLVVVWSTVSD